MVILLANVGSHDLQRREAQTGGETPPTTGGGPRQRVQLASGRAAAQDILDRYDDGAAEEVTWPIVSKYLEYLDVRGVKGAHVVLFGTDQPVEKIEERFRQNDTIIAAQVLKRLITDHGGDVAAAVEAVPVTVAGAHRHDDMLAFFQQDVPRRRRDDQEEIYVAVTGGTPAANLGLLFAAQVVWGDRVKALVAPDDRGPAFVPDVVRQMRVAFQRQPVIDLFRAGQFATAAGIVRSWGEQKLEAFAFAADALRHWLDLAHDDAHTSVIEAIELTSRHGLRNIEPVLHDLQRDLRPRRGATGRYGDGATELLFRDVYWNADLCLSQARYVDFVARMALLVERIPRLLVETAVDASAPETKNDEASEPFWTAVHNRGLPESAGRALHYGAWEAFVKHLFDAGEASAKAVYQRLVALQKLRELRNESIVGHRFAAVNEATIADRLDEALAKYYRRTPDTADASRGSRGVQRAVSEMLDGGLRIKLGSDNHFLTYGDRLARALLEAPL